VAAAVDPGYEPNHAPEPSCCSRARPRRGGSAAPPWVTSRSASDCWRSPGVSGGDSRGRRLPASRTGQLATARWGTEAAVSDPSTFPAAANLFTCRPAGIPYPTEDAAPAATFARGAHSHQADECGSGIRRPTYAAAVIIGPTIWRALARFRGEAGVGKPVASCESPPPNAEWVARGWDWRLSRPTSTFIPSLSSA